MSVSARALSANISVPNEGATTSLGFDHSCGKAAMASRVAASFADDLTEWLCVCFAIASIAPRACTSDRWGAAALAVPAPASMQNIPASSSASDSRRPTVIRPVAEPAPCIALS